MSELGGCLRESGMGIGPGSACAIGRTCPGSGRGKAHLSGKREEGDGGKPVWRLWSFRRYSEGSGAGEFVE